MAKAQTRSKARSGKVSKVVVRKAYVPKQKKAGISFPVGRLHRMLKQGRYSERFGIGGAVFMAATLQYLTSEILELAGEVTEEKKKKTISPSHMMSAIRGDEELVKLLATIQISSGGTRSNIHPFLRPAKKGKKAGGADEANTATQQMWAERQTHLKSAFVKLDVSFD